MESHRIGVISDTHGLLRPEIMDHLRTCEVILHAGDIDNAKVLERLNEICRTYVVRGNADKEWAGEIPAELEAGLFGFRIYMVHNKKHIREDLSGVDIVIFGHSHKYETGSRDGIMYLNPGGCGPRRFHLPVTMMILTLYPEKHGIEVSKIDCSPVISGAKELSGLSEKDMHRLIKEVMKSVDAGRSVGEIASRNRIEEELVKQICRIYVTHPGVDVDGIMNRMEIKDL